ncbi:hypothetical protein EC968_010376 [Mortierella alpina]|nr:hypothetical protein EC968_010376 [Mortierella alpina]
MSSARAPITHHATPHSSQDAPPQPAPEPTVLYGTSIDYQERRQRIRLMPPSPPANQNPFNAPTIRKLETMFDRVLALAQSVKAPARPAAFSPALSSSSSSSVPKRPNAFHPYRPLHRPLHYPGKPEEQDTIAAHPTPSPVRSQKRAERIPPPPTRSIWSTLSSEAQAASEAQPGSMKNSSYRHLLPPADAATDTESLSSDTRSAQDAQHQHSISRVVNDLSEQALLAPKYAALSRPKPQAFVEREKSPDHAANGRVDSDSSVVELLSSDNEEDAEDDADEVLEEIDNHPGEEHDYEDYDSEQDYEDEEDTSDDHQPEDEDYEPEEEIVDLDDSDEEDEDLRRRQQNERNRLLRGPMGMPRQPPVAVRPSEAYQQSKISDDDAEHSQDDAEAEAPSDDDQEDVFELSERQDEYSDSNMEDGETAPIRLSADLEKTVDDSVGSPSGHLSRHWPMESVHQEGAGRDDHSKGDAVLLLDSDDDEALDAGGAEGVAFDEEEEEEPYSDAEHDSQDRDDYITDSSVGEDEEESSHAVELESGPFEMDEHDEAHDIEDIRSIEDVEDVEDVDDVEDGEDIEEVDDVEDVENVEDVDDVDNVEDIEDVEDAEDVEDVGDVKEATAEEEEGVNPDNYNAEIHTQSAPKENEENKENREDGENKSTPAQLLEETMELLRSSDSNVALDELSQHAEGQMDVDASVNSTVEDRPHKPIEVQEEQDLPVLETDDTAQPEALVVEQHGTETWSAVMDASESIDIPGAVGFGDMAPLQSLADPDSNAAIDFSTINRNTSTISDMIQQSLVDMEGSPSTTEQVTVQEVQTVSISIVGQTNQLSEEPTVLETDSTVSTSTRQDQTMTNENFLASDQEQESVLPPPSQQYEAPGQVTVPADSSAAHVSLLERLRAVAHEEGITLSSFTPMPSQVHRESLAESPASPLAMNSHQQHLELEDTHSREASLPLPSSDFTLPSGRLDMESGVEESDTTTVPLSPLQPRKTRLARTGTMAQTVREGKAFIEHAEAKQGSFMSRPAESPSTAPLTLEDLTGPADVVATTHEILEPTIAPSHSSLQPPSVRRGELALLVEEARAFCSGVPTPARAGSSLAPVVSPSSTASTSALSTATEADFADLAAAQSASARGMSPSRLVGFARRRVSLTSSTTDMDKGMDRSSTGSGSEPQQQALSSSISSTTSSGSSSYQQVVTPRKVGVVDLAAEKVIQSTVVGSHALRPFINPPSPAGSGLAGSRSNSQEPTFSVVSPPHSQASPFFTFGQTPLGTMNSTAGGGTGAGGAGALGSASVGFGFGSSFVATKEKKGRVTSPVMSATAAAAAAVKAPSPRSSPTKAAISKASQLQHQVAPSKEPLEQQDVQQKDNEKPLAEKEVTAEREEQVVADDGQDEINVDDDEEEEEEEEEGAKDVGEESDAQQQQQEQQPEQQEQQQQDIDESVQNRPGSIFVRMAKRKRSPSSSRNKNQQRRAAKKLLKQQTSNHGAGDSHQE